MSFFYYSFMPFQWYFRTRWGASSLWQVRVLVKNSILFGHKVVGIVKLDVFLLRVLVLAELGRLLVQFLLHKALVGLSAGLLYDFLSNLLFPFQLLGHLIYFEGLLIELLVHWFSQRTLVVFLVQLLQYPVLHLHLLQFLAIARSYLR